MKLSLVVDGTVRVVDLARGVDCGMPLHFGGPQPRVFGADPATAEPMTGPGFVGSIEFGGTANAPVVRINPHCNGTHTESALHVSADGPPVRDAAPTAPLPATLVTIEPIAAGASTDETCPEARPDDRVVTADLVEDMLVRCGAAFRRGLVLRDLPTRGPWTNYDRIAPPYLTAAAARRLAAAGVEHLVVTWPSVDRLSDGGRLAAHRAFWSVAETGVGRPHATITELACIPDGVPDGPVLLFLAVPAFDLDVAPSRPILFPVTGPVDEP